MKKDYEKKRIRTGEKGKGEKMKAEANQGDKRQKRHEKYGKEFRWSNGAKAN